MVLQEKYKINIISCKELSPASGLYYKRQYQQIQLYNGELSMALVFLLYYFSEFLS